ncbi:hypothetical protein [Serpentinicella alkaliphila]|uniref:Uncharacterized protein n=1 Tax=Serpentinicella alkaliphila TaxID=1734049 RepID=A0A4R2TVZ6_9FIRM|nr:hypothetical protein [Serpentinicella alkaliphila]QUH26872.1 hypothetical protein HZR23_14830 [Serpentinicella alkaliphila]TCQ08101.1 hypothetical protein EDD79_1001189 [Serpentinicella alkaliphila]
MESNKLNKDVTEVLDSLGHPMRNEIELLRKIIMSSRIEIKEGIKWNCPNCSIGNEIRLDYPEVKSTKANTRCFP